MKATNRRGRSAIFSEVRAASRRKDRGEPLGDRPIAELNESRRAAIRGIGRWLLASLSLSEIAALARRPKTTCDLRAICRNCAAFDACDFPKARKTRRDERTGGE